MAAISPARESSKILDQHKCAVCSELTELSCPCKIRYYCGKACQRYDWPKHRKVCIAHKSLPYEKAHSILRFASSAKILPPPSRNNLSLAANNTSQKSEEKSLPHNEEEYLLEQWHEIAREHGANPNPYSYADPIERYFAFKHLNETTAFLINKEMTPQVLIEIIKRNFEMKPEYLQAIFNSSNPGDCLFLGEGNGLQALPAILEGVSTPSIVRNYTITDTPDMIAGSKDKFNELLELLTNSQPSLEHIAIDMHEMEIKPNQYALINLVNCIQYMDPQKVKKLLLKIRNGLTDNGVLFLNVYYLKSNQRPEGTPKLAAFSSFKHALQFLKNLGFTPDPEVQISPHPANNKHYKTTYLCLKKTRA